MGSRLIVAVLAVALAGCVSVNRPEPRPASYKEVWCERSAPRRPAQATFDAMTRTERDEMNAHNDQGVRWCGWKP